MTAPMRTQAEIDRRDNLAEGMATAIRYQIAGSLGERRPLVPEAKRIIREAIATERARFEERFPELRDDPIDFDVVNDSAGNVTVVRVR
jgi:hypothetical protein